MKTRTKRLQIHHIPYHAFSKTAIFNDTSRSRGVFAIDFPIPTVEHINYEMSRRFLSTFRSLQSHENPLVSHV